MSQTQNFRSRSLKFRTYIFVVYYCIFALNSKILAEGLAKRNFDNQSRNIGWMSPNGEVIKHTGQDLEIFCTLNSKLTQTTNFTSQNLKFLRDDTLWDSQNVTRVNETAISLYLANENESKFMYECVLMDNDTKSTNLTPQEIHIVHGTGYNLSMNNKHDLSISNSSNRSETSIGSIHVVVAEKPKEVLNLTCILYHWSILNCSWVSQVNYVETNYTIQYVPLNVTITENIVQSERKNLSSFDSTPVKPSSCLNDYESVKSFCIWPPITNPGHSIILEKLNITLTGENIFGKINQDFIFNLFEHARPEAPTNLTADSITSSSIMLKWHSDPMPHYPVEWMFTLYVYKSNPWSDENMFEFSQKLSRWGEHILYSVKNLMPNLEYTFLISQKLPFASDVAEYWSDFSNLTVQTRPLPALSPETEIGSFKILDSGAFSTRRLVDILWKPIENITLYGDMRYNIEVSETENDGNVQLAENSDLIAITPWFARYEIGHSVHHFSIKSTNSEGSALKANLVTVPASNQLIQKPIPVYIVDFCQNNRSMTDYYEFIWLPQKEQSEIVNYTIYWRGVPEDKYQRVLGDPVVGLIVLPANIDKYRIEINYKLHLPPANSRIRKNGILRIAANSRNSSTGLQFPTARVTSVSDVLWHSSPWFLSRQQYVSKM